jgi:hypothetical protein
MTIPFLDASILRRRGRGGNDADRCSGRGAHTLHLASVTRGPAASAASLVLDHGPPGYGATIPEIEVRLMRLPKATHVIVMPIRAACKAVGRTSSTTMVAA